MIDAPRDIGKRVLELLATIDAERPELDEARAAERLQAYVQALGLPAPGVRFEGDLRALRDGRVGWRGDRGYWPAFMGRQAWLLDPRWPEREVRSPGGAEPPGSSLASADRTVLSVGLGASRYLHGVRQVTPSLLWRADQLRAGGSLPSPKRAAALVPLAEAAAAGLFAFALGEGPDLVALLRPRLRFDEEGRLHDWDGRPAAEWSTGRGLYFWRGVEMTESAGSKPDAVTALRIAGWANAERRRVAIERMGLELFLEGLGATAVQQDDYGTLWRTEREVGGEPFVAVEVVNATVEPDDSRRRYFLRVPPDTRTARRGVAWTFGLTKRSYAPVLES